MGVPLQKCCFCTGLCLCTATMILKRTLQLHTGACIYTGIIFHTAGFAAVFMNKHSAADRAMMMTGSSATCRGNTALALQLSKWLQGYWKGVRVNRLMRCRCACV